MLLDYKGWTNVFNIEYIDSKIGKSSDHDSRIFKIDNCCVLELEIFITNTSSKSGRFLRDVIHR